MRSPVDTCGAASPVPWYSLIVSIMSSKKGFSRPFLRSWVSISAARRRRTGDPSLATFRMATESPGRRDDPPRGIVRSVRLQFRIRTVFVFNPAAGKGRVVRDRDAIRAALEKAGAGGTFVETERVGHGIALAEDAARDGAEAVVAIGGDGTVNEVVNGLLRVAEPGRPAFGVVPDGTGNDYGYLLGLRPGDLDGAARVIAAGATRVLDAGEVNGRFFANSVGLGFDGAVAETAAKVRYLKGFPAYLWSVFKVLRTWENFELTLTVDGRTISGRA